MTIDFTKNGEILLVNLEGRLDTQTAPEFENFLKTNLQGADSVEINCEKLTYVSSAGLRVLLSAHKKMHGNMKLINVCELVMEVFEITGFVDILNVK